ncbi:MAG: type II toxin-antitoxin system HicA family toxin [Desulfatiglandales bacterium]
MRISPTNWKTQIKIFKAYGCKYKRKKGSHHVLTYPGAKRAVVIPEYDEIDVDVIKNNMRTVGMSREDYLTSGNPGNPVARSKPCHL